MAMDKAWARYYPALQVLEEPLVKRQAEEVPRID